MRTEMKSMQTTILLQDARIKAQDSRIEVEKARTMAQELHSKAQDARIKAQELHSKAQDARIKAQDDKIAQQDARLVQLEKQVRPLTDPGKESTNTNHGQQGHGDPPLGFMNNSLPNAATKSRRNVPGDYKIENS